MENSLKNKIVLIGFLSLIVLIICPCIGMEFISPFKVFQDSSQYVIFFNIRIPRALTAFICGGALAMCGMVFQAIFRNPLAEPFTLGIASGASCGAAVSIFSGFTALLPGIPMISIGAFIGAFIAMALVSGIAIYPNKSNSYTMLLAGVAVSFLFSSLLMIIQYASSMRDSFHIVRWLMGGLEVYGYRQVITMSALVLVGLVVIFRNLAEIDHFITGEDIAQSRGVDVVKIRNLLILACTIMIAGVVANCGPIGFVGLIIPYFSRKYFKMAHKILAPVSFLAGGSFLLICDTLSRTILGTVEVPVGVITSFCGAPFFLWILLGDKKNLHSGIFN
jgi:iron complex transport system permease protein